MHEQSTNPQPASEAFLNAEGTLYDIVEQDDFALACVNHGLDPVQSVTDPAYWEIVEGMVHERVRTGEKAGESELDLAALQITAYTPLFIHAEQLLNGNHTLGTEQYHALKERVSYFNSLVRYVGSNYEDVKPSDVSNAMLGAAEIADLSGTETDNWVRSTMRGAQHELAFGQLLAASGTEFRASELAEDLRGIDYVVKVKNKIIFVDVKASLSEIAAYDNSGLPFAVHKAKNRYQHDVTVIYSMVRDSELGDSFTLPAEVAAERAAKLGQILEQASKRSKAA